VKVTAAAGSNTFMVNQSITTGNFSTLFALAPGSSVFNSSCADVSATFKQTSINAMSNKVTVKFNASSAGTYYIAIKLSTSSVNGKPAPTPSTVGDNFKTSGVAGSSANLKMVKK
jgi:hypothetical protein